MERGLLEELRSLVGQINEKFRQLEELIVEKENIPPPSETEGRPTPPSTILTSRPSTPDRHVPLGQKPDFSTPDNDGRSLPGYAHEWAKKVGGIAHKHRGQLHVGTCPNCTHINNIAHPESCVHRCHEPPPTPCWCPWCGQPGLSFGPPDPSTPGGRTRR